VRIPPDMKPKLVAALSPAWERCGGKPGTVVLDLETTRREVVDVKGVVAVDESALDERSGKCIVEAAWALELDGAFRRIQRQSFSITL
jgi:hypothetical protein